MTDIGRDINDDEIRIISSDDRHIQLENSSDEAGYEVKDASRDDTKRIRHIIYGFLLVILILLGIVALTRYINAPNIEVGEETVLPQTEIPVQETLSVDNPTQQLRKFTVNKDTTVNRVGLSIYIPCNATPTLEIGSQALQDSSVVLMVQAADVRRDNGEIVCSFVVKGELVSKGEAKAGFCSIINGKISIGTADATPMFEEALMSDGYFFRQYPLVVAGQVVENKLKGKSIRRALVEIDGNVEVIISRMELTLHDFSQVLVDVGARNAIYIVGGNSNGCYVNEAGEKVSLCTHWNDDIENVNYIVWR